LRRLLFIDMFRGLAVLVMLQGHVINSTILHSIKATKGFHYLDLLHGMIAPSFIFISGFAFTLGLERKWDSYLRFEKPLWLQIRRLLFVLALAYWLHLPAWSFQTLLKLNRDSILYFLRCDVLQLIVFSLLFLLLLCVTVRNHRVVMSSLPLIVLAVVFVTPFLYFVDTRKYLPLPVSDYINALYGALFPLFPWAAYSFAGAFICRLYLRACDAGKEARFLTILAILGAVFFVSAFVLFYTPWQYYKYVDPARSSPRHFMMKIGFIFMILPALRLYETKMKPEKSILNTVGQESLMVYGLHLILVYGASFMPYHLSKSFGASLTYGPAFTITFLLMVSMTIAALAWNRLKTKRPLLAKRLFYGACAIYFLRFFAT